MKHKNRNKPGFEKNLLLVSVELIPPIEQDQYHLWRSVGQSLALSIIHNNAKIQKLFNLFSGIYLAADSLSSKKGIMSYSQIKIDKRIERG